MMSEQRRDTVAVLRQLGIRRIASALVRRANSELRTSWSRVVGKARLDPSAPEFVAALRKAPSLVPGKASLADPPAPSSDLSDPRLRWEEGRGARMVAQASRGEANFAASLRTFLQTPREDDPLETAIRVWNLGVALSLHGPLDDNLTAAVAAELVRSARLIESRLEDRGLVVGSHLVGELVGLEVCGLLLQGAGSEPPRWRAQARTGLAREARVQVLADGGGVEGSSGYSRFVAELWLASMSLARAAGDEPSPAVVAAARAMLAHLADTLAPDGGHLAIGDDDSSIVLPGGTDVASIVPLLALWPLSERPEGVTWSPVAEIVGGPAARARWEAAREVPWPSSVHAKDFGVALARRGGLGGDLVAVRAGAGGQGGAGGHSHNDALSVTVWMDGKRVVVDPGTGVYLGRPALRDRFRGVAAHPTVVVDGLEPSELPATRPFALPDQAKARLVSVEDDGKIWRCVAEHVGYAKTGVRLRREVRFDRASGDVEIRDLVEGTGVHRVEVSFPLAGAATLDGDAVVTGNVRLESGDRRLSWRLDEGAISSRYGSIEPGAIARRGGRVELPVTLITNIARMR